MKQVVESDVAFDIMYMLTTLMNKTTCPSIRLWRKKVKNTTDNRDDLWWKGVLKMDIKRKFRVTSKVYIFPQ